jgi:hypothetical protein
MNRLKKDSLPQQLPGLQSSSNSSTFEQLLLQHSSGSLSSFHATNLSTNPSINYELFLLYYKQPCNQHRLTDRLRPLITPQLNRPFANRKWPHTIAAHNTMTQPTLPTCSAWSLIKDVNSSDHTRIQWNRSSHTTTHT